MVLMMQKEAVERIWANSGTKEYHALSIFINNAYEFTETLSFETMFLSGPRGRLYAYPNGSQRRCISIFAAGQKPDP